MVQNWVGPGGPGTRSQGRRCGAWGGTAEGVRGAGALGRRAGPRGRAAISETSPVNME